VVASTVLTLIALANRAPAEGAAGLDPGARVDVADLVHGELTRGS